MPVFDQLCHAAQKAHEKNLISKQLAERICRIGSDRLHFKHLGLELHGLVAQLTPSAGNCLPSSGIEDLVQQLEAKHRRL
jgi:hypothetical protein